ncbi:MAG: class B sortase, partial [Clostridiales bacterium]|nr:class B sortase [Clostridiales bacterium]
DGLAATNSSFVGVLYVPSLDILYPVAQSMDDAEYLHKTFEGKNLFAGCIFLEKSSEKDLGGWNTWIFGHNMNNGSMFGSLKKFLKNSSLCDSDPYFYIYTKDTVFKYRIFAYHTTKLGGPLYRYVTTNEEYDAFIDDIQEESVYEDGKNVNLSTRPRIVTLSTCYATGHVKSFVVHGAITGEYSQ